MKLCKKIAASALALLLCGAAASYARDMYIGISAADTYECKFRNYDARIVTPHISGLTVDKLQDKLNTSFADSAESLKKRFEERRTAEFANDPESDEHYSVEMDYFVHTFNNMLLTVEVSETTQSTIKSTKRRFYTFDKGSRLVLELRDLFNERANYVKVINGYIQKEMQKANKKEEGRYWLAPEHNPGFKSIKPDQNFYINANGEIVICFDSFEVSSEEGGTPEFIIPKKVTSPYLLKRYQNIK